MREKFLKSFMNFVKFYKFSEDLLIIIIDIESYSDLNEARHGYFMHFQMLKNFKFNIT